MLIAEEMVELGPVQALAALFDDGLPAPGLGDPLPPLWHWAALATWPRAGLTGPDGHPVGDFLPDVGKPRRMFAGGSVRFEAPLIVGQSVLREREILSIAEKSGTQGDFVLVRVQTTVRGTSGQTALVEIQDLVFRDPAAPRNTEHRHPPVTQSRVVPRLLARRNEDSWEFHTDTTKLMRFSSATSNAHRIHYDWPYATGSEGYPGLVVHGPLMTLAMAEAVRQTTDGAVVAEVSHRNLRPLFCGQPALIRLHRETGLQWMAALGDESRTEEHRARITVTLR